MKRFPAPLSRLEKGSELHIGFDATMLDVCVRQENSTTLTRPWLSVMTWESKREVIAFAITPFSPTAKHPITHLVLLEPFAQAFRKRYRVIYADPSIFSPELVAEYFWSATFVIPTPYTYNRFLERLLFSVSTTFSDPTSLGYLDQNAQLTESTLREELKTVLRSYGKSKSASGVFATQRTGLQCL